MGSCIYHQFDDGQGLNGNVGPGIGFDNPSIDGQIEIVAIPDNLVKGADGNYYDKITGEKYGPAVFNNNEPRRLKNGSLEQFPTGLDEDGDGIRDAAHTRLPVCSLQQIKGERYDSSIPSIALSSKQVAAIRDTNPNFGLGDDVLVTANGKMVSMKFFDYADDATHTANNKLSHTEFNRAAYRAFGLEGQLTANSAPAFPVVVIAKLVKPGQQYFIQKYPENANKFIGYNNPDDKARGR